MILKRIQLVYSAGSTQSTTESFAHLAATLLVDGNEGENAHGNASISTHKDLQAIYRCLITLVQSDTPTWDPILSLNERERAVLRYLMRSLSQYVL